MNTLKKRKISSDAEVQLSIMLLHRMEEWIYDRSYFRSLFPKLRELSMLTPFLAYQFENDYLELYYGLR